jgi:hypothetical protein
MGQPTQPQTQPACSSRSSRSRSSAHHVLSAAHPAADAAIGAQPQEQVPAASQTARPLFNKAEDRMTDQQQQDALDQLSINTLRFLAVDQVEKAKSGHPGAPLGCAPIAYLLYHKIMKYNPADPLWSDRDRFVLSNGHASALLYGVLHLTGYDLPMEQLEQFRSGDRTPRGIRSTARRRAWK